MTNTKQKPVAWMYESWGHIEIYREPNEYLKRMTLPCSVQRKWTETPLYAAPVSPPPVEAGAPRPDRDVIAYSIIEGSAGIRAAEHAKDFQTANWTDALRSADSVIACLAALSQPGSSESGGFEREIETSDGRLVTVRVALKQAAEAYAIARGNGHHGPGYNPVDVLRRAFLPSTPSSKER